MVWGREVDKEQHGKEGRKEEWKEGRQAGRGEREGRRKGGKRREEEGEGGRGEKKREEAFEQLRRFQSLPPFKPICRSVSMNCIHKCSGFPFSVYMCLLTVRTSQQAKCDSCV